MIIWGTRGFNSTVDTGAFHCPRCGPDKSFSVVAVKRWFTLYFIPVIPMGEAGRFLECRSCGGTFDEKARDHDPEAEQAKFRAEFGSVMLRAMAALARADGRTDHRELEVIADVMTRLTGTAHETDEIQEAIDGAGNEPLDKVLKEVSGSLSDQGKTLVIHGLTMVAKADGNVGEEELEVVFRAGKTLGLRRADVQKIMSIDDG